ncbi:MAG: putative dihydroorotase [Pirellulaceae bacterium]|nr:MAG: putative dihydroorotase [Pirellulaceae bacterium]
MQHERWLIEHGRLVSPADGLDRPGRLLLVDGRIAAIDPADGDLPPDVARVDASGCYVIPGLVDIGAELGEPGREEDETIETGTAAALAGGYTSLACAASTDPPIDTPAGVEFVRQKAARADGCRVYVIGCVSKGRQGDELAEIGGLVEAGAVALSDAPKPLHNTALLRRALEYCAMFDRPVLDMPEVPSLTRGGVMHEGLTQLVLALAPMPAEAEDLATSRDLRLLETTGGRLHLTSISTSGGVELVRRAKARHSPVTVGVHIANLCFCDQQMRTFDSSLKVNPPLRSPEHIEACLEAVADGTIDVIASGHQPRSLEKKMQELDAVPFGMTTLDTALAQAHTYLVRTGKLDFARLVQCMATGPARVLDLPAGRLAPQVPGDVVIFDPQARWTVTPQTMGSRSRNTPLLNQELVGRVRDVWVGGRRKKPLDDRTSPSGN